MVEQIFYNWGFKVLRGKAEGLSLFRHRLTWVLLVSGSVGLFATTIYRAATFPFVHDESLSFSIFAWNSSWRLTANNHLLNTYLMELCSTGFGNSELSLRLPNILAHLLYLVCTLLILKRIQTDSLRLAGFIFLNLNLFLLDFFFLARGYGLALGFMMLSLYLLVRAFEHQQKPGFGPYLFFSILAGYLAVLANFSFLNFQLPLIVVSTGLLFYSSRLNPTRFSHLKETTSLIFLNGIALAFILPKIFALRRGGGIYFGGKEGFIVDTVGSLVRCSLYLEPHALINGKVLSLLLIAIFMICLLFWLWQLTLLRKINLFVLFLPILLLAVVFPIIYHHFLLVFFPIERAALYYLPLFGLVLIFAVNSVNDFSRFDWLSPLLTGSLLIAAFFPAFYFFGNLTFTGCFTWKYDTHNKEVIDQIRHDAELNFPGRVVVLSNSWQLEPSLNYYRFTRNFSWLAPVLRAPIGAYPCQYIYAFKRDIVEGWADKYQALTSYPDTNTVLLRLKQDTPKL